MRRAELAGWCKNGASTEKSSGSEQLSAAVTESPRVFVSNVPTTRAAMGAAEPAPAATMTLATRRERTTPCPARPGS
jgi:hypothetical protein